MAKKNEIIEKVFSILMKPQGLRKKLLKRFVPELTEIADLLREEYYWKEPLPQETD